MSATFQAKRALQLVDELVGMGVLKQEEKLSIVEPSSGSDGSACVGGEGCVVESRI